MINVKPIIVIGCGGHALSVIDLISTHRNFEIVGLVGKKKDLGKNILGYPVLGTDEDLGLIRSKVNNAVMGIGQIKNAKLRYEKFQLLKSYDYKTPNILSSNSYVSPYASIGEGTSIGHQAIVNADASIGKCCILNSKSLVEHGCSIGDFCHLSTGVLINGDVSLGDNCFIGSGTIIREGINIPNNTVIGAGKCIMGWPLSGDNL